MKLGLLCLLDETDFLTLKDIKAFLGVLYKPQQKKKRTDVTQLFRTKPFVLSMHCGYLFFVYLLEPSSNLLITITSSSSFFAYVKMRSTWRAPGFQMLRSWHSFQRNTKSHDETCPCLIVQHLSSTVMHVFGSITPKKLFHFSGRSRAKLLLWWIFCKPRVEGESQTKQETSF